MSDCVYLQVDSKFHCPVETEVALFVWRFNQISGGVENPQAGRSHDHQLTCPFQINLVKRSETCYIGTLPEHVLSGPGVETQDEKEIPSSVRCCLLPSAVSHNKHMVHSGLCGVLRQIVKLTHKITKCQKSLELLGFKQGCLKACSEVSQWTKFCEVDVPLSVTEAIKQNRTSLPDVFQKLEEHLGRPPPVANREKKIRDLKKKRAAKKSSNVAVEIQSEINSKSNDASVRKCTMNLNDFSLVSNTSGKGEGSPSNKQSPTSGAGDTIIPKEKDKVIGLNCDTADARDEPVILERTFTEGPDMTLTDLVLFTCISWYLKHTNTGLSSLDSCCPLVARWLNRMLLVPGILESAEYLDLRTVSSQDTKLTLDIPIRQRLEQIDIKQDAKYSSKRQKVKTEDVLAVIQKLQDAGLEPTISDHPCGPDVKLDWDSFPAGVHPKEGDLPKSRMERKCQQLENLTGAVVQIAKPGDIIVDFCSGGGHLGIAVAYLLPDCKVILVENKEESIGRGLKRVEDLGLKNITLYQSNLDYFQGTFNIGLCLHACGVATDLVLQKCLDVEADFVICPCCYGSIKNTHTMTYPRSEEFSKLDMSYEEYTHICHAADQTQTNSPLAKQGKQCMVWVDNDRCSLAKSRGYSVTLCSLQPLSCTPKNNLLIGTHR